GDRLMVRDGLAEGDALLGVAGGVLVGCAQEPHEERRTIEVDVGERHRRMARERLRGRSIEEKLGRSGRVEAQWTDRLHADGAAFDDESAIAPHDDDRMRTFRWAPSDLARELALTQRERARQIDDERGPP